MQCKPAEGPISLRKKKQFNLRSFLIPFLNRWADKHQVSNILTSTLLRLSLLRLPFCSPYIFDFLLPSDLSTPPVPLTLDFQTCPKKSLRFPLCTIVFPWVWSSKIVLFPINECSFSVWNKLKFWMGFIRGWTCEIYQFISKTSSCKHQRATLILAIRFLTQNVKIENILHIICKNKMVSVFSTDQVVVFFLL